MTPDKRLNQIQPIMADVLQKVDRLVEGQGQLVEFAVNTKAELEEVKTTLNEQVIPLLTEQVVPTLNNHVVPLLNGHVVPLLNDHVVPLLNDHVVPLLNDHVVPLLNDHVVPTLDQHVVPTLEQVKTTGEITATGLAKLTVTVAELRDEMRERFDRSEQTQQEMRERFERSEQTQQEILTILRSQMK